MRARILAIFFLVVLSIASGGAFQRLGPIGAPETFVANLNVTTSGGAGAATIEIHIQSYPPAAERDALLGALKQGGYAEFLAALRKAPQVGTVSVADRKWAIRWAREQRAGKYSRSIVVVTDQPLFFVGGGRVDAKPREGYEMAVIQLEIDDAGLGRGTMTAAARVAPGGESGVQVEDYAEKPIRLVTVTRKLQ